MFDLQTEIEEFRDREYRESYADEFLNTYVANQIRVIREQRGMSQEQLASIVGTKQAGISRIENVNYSGWNIRTLKKIARAFGCRLHISFETYGSLLEEGVGFIRKALERPTFEEDPVFKAISTFPKSGIHGKVLPIRDQDRGVGSIATRGFASAPRTLTNTPNRTPKIDQQLCASNRDIGKVA